MLINGVSVPLDFYPISLTQISTMGTIHNLTPIAQNKLIPEVEGGPPEHTIPIFRFYFDGLVPHVHRQASDDGTTLALGPLIVGVEKKLVVSTVTYEESFERTNLLTLMAEVSRHWPDVIAKLQ